MTKYAQNQLGISLVQTVIAMGLSLGIALMIMQSSHNAQLSQNNMMQNFESQNILYQAEQTIRDKNSCLATFNLNGNSGGTPASNISTIKRLNVDGTTRDVISVDETYSSGSAGGSIRIVDIGFAVDATNAIIQRDISPQFNYEFPRGSGTTVTAVTSSVDFLITISKKNFDAAGNEIDKVKSFGAQEIKRSIKGLRVITRTDNDQIVGCFSPQDEYVGAACSALGGTISATTGDCTNLNVNRITAGEVIGVNNLQVQDCLTISAGMGPSPVSPTPSALYTPSGALCSKNILNASRNSSNGSFAAQTDLWKGSGRLIVGMDQWLAPGVVPGEIKAVPNGLELTSQGEFIIARKKGSFPAGIGGVVRFEGEGAAGNVGNVLVNGKGLSVDGSSGAAPFVVRNGASMSLNQGGTFTIRGGGTIDGTNSATIANMNRIQTQNMELRGSMTGPGGININGSFVSGSTICANSDERLKQNFVRIDNAVEKISQLDGWYFNWLDELKDLQEGTQIGLKAQQIQKVFPELVEANED